MPLTPDESRDKVYLYITGNNAYQVDWYKVVLMNPRPTAWADSAVYSAINANA